MLPLLGSRWGGYAEYVAVKEEHLAKVIDDILVLVLIAYWL